MTTWYKKKYIFLVIFYLVLGNQDSLLAKITGFGTDSNTIYSISNKTEGLSLLAQKTFICQNLDSAYQEVYSFETEEYFISICQLEEDFYYYRQSKENIKETLLVRAESVFGGDVFQATDGRTIYFIGQDGDRYYSSVMKNNSEIVFEPEIESTAISSDNIQSVSSATAIDNPETEVEVDLELRNPENFSSQSLICANENSAFHPHLDGWQKLIGKSPDIANRYAIDNGHNFIYRQNSPQQALIKTREGGVVNLDIAVAQDTIDRVCVEPLTE